MCMGDVQVEGWAGFFLGGQATFPGYRGPNGREDVTQVVVWQVGPPEWWEIVRGMLIPCDQPSYCEEVFSDMGQI